MGLEVLIQSDQMRKKNLAPQLLSQSNFTDAYWTLAQMVTHHTVNGCNLKPGDLLGSGTMSGASPGSQGALIEITEGGNNPIKLSSG
jgi:fumarylacetoacetase